MNHRFQFHQRGQLFIRPHNETLSIAAMCVCYPMLRPLEPTVDTQPNSNRLC
jgi:hypothetical protein